jgi:DNA-binding response OmpR family regulator
MRPTQPDPARFRILIVEDDADMGVIATLVLRDAGFDSHHVGNGHQALDAIHARRYDLILLDLMMPGMDGLTFLAERRRRHLAEGTPVLCVSAASSAMRDGARRLGAAECLPKPTDFDQLADRVAHHCARA